MHDQRMHTDFLAHHAHTLIWFFRQHFHFSAAALEDRKESVRVIMKLKHYVDQCIRTTHTQKDFDDYPLTIHNQAVIKVEQDHPVIGDNCHYDALLDLYNLLA